MVENVKVECPNCNCDVSDCVLREDRHEDYVVCPECGSLAHLYREKAAEHKLIVLFTILAVSLAVAIASYILLLMFCDLGTFYCVALSYFSGVMTLIFLIFTVFFIAKIKRKPQKDDLPAPCLSDTIKRKAFRC